MIPSAHQDPGPGFLGHVASENDSQKWQLHALITRSNTSSTFPKRVAQTASGKLFRRNVKKVRIPMGIRSVLALYAPGA